MENKEITKEWKNYEDFSRGVVRDFAHLLGIKADEVESKQKIKGKFTEWEIEIVAYDDKTHKMVVGECKNWVKSKLTQEHIGGFAYRVKDLGAERGIIVNRKGLQKGAKKIASGENISSVILKPPFDPDNYKAQIDEFIVSKLTAKPIIASPKIHATIQPVVAATIEVKPKISVEIIKKN